MTTQIPQKEWGAYRNRKMEDKNIIIVAGVKFDDKRFPRLYRFAQTNQEGLEKTLRSLAEASGGNQDNLTMDAINLENDLAHG